MTLKIAWKNLSHDPMRFLATLIGIVFAVTLMSIQGGLFRGFAQIASGLVDHAGADIWIASRGTRNVDQSHGQSERSLYKALQVDGISEISRMIVNFVIWKKPNGGTELVILVGADPRSSMGRPWNVVAGRAEQLDEPDSVMIDKLYLETLGVSSIGQEVEISRRRARVVGFTQGITTFGQAPYVFTSYNSALKMTSTASGGANYFLVKVKPGVSASEVAKRLQAIIPNVDVWTSPDFAKQTQDYWIYSTGAGASLIMGAILGALVGFVIVSQTLYAATIERISEYATLSAIGASTEYLNSIVLTQAAIVALLGSIVGLAISYVVSRLVAGIGPTITLSIPLAFGVCFGSLAICGLSSVLAIRKLMRIDPTSVFK